jgi:Heterokaryon incompatibility protein (HET)
MHPEWYIVHPSKNENDAEYLCVNCRHIDLYHLLYEAKPQQTAHSTKYIRLGPMEEISREANCGLCKLVSLTIAIHLLRNAGNRETLNDEEQRIFDSYWYLSPFVYSHQYYGAGYRLFLRPNLENYEKKSECAKDDRYLLLTWPFALRLVTTSGRGGRLIPDGHLDFDWIRMTIDRCELSTDMPSRRFKYTIRAVDTCEMCIVDVHKEDRYVALSYAWGNFPMAKLLRENEASLRIPGSLATLSGIPLTMQDAITLVRNVGERYLWIDTLCILQDSETDLKQQMGQMGELYSHSYFTIFAISGKDANYGLPGVRYGTRKIKQAVCQVGDLTMANALPWMEEEDLLEAGAWGSRGWTFQERFSSQRGLFIGDNGMIINCAHTYSPEDENCTHPYSPGDEPAETGNRMFFAGQHKGCVPYIQSEETFDIFSLLVAEYTRRSLTYQTDALSAFLGVSQTLERRFPTKMIHGLPEAELDAAILWSPLGSNSRRRHPITKEPLFPSWSWLGWVGPVAYPWTLERDTFMTIVNSPLKWQDAVVAHNRIASCKGMPTVFDARDLAIGQEAGTDDDGWFTSDDLCLPNSPTRAALLRILRKKTPNHLGVRRLCADCRNVRSAWLNQYMIDWPGGIEPRFQYVLPDGASHRLSFRTLSAYFYVVGKPFRRPKLYNMEHPIHRLSLVDEENMLVGYIDIPDPAGTRKYMPLGRREFVVLSRSNGNGKFEPEPDILGTSRRLGMIRFSDIPRYRPGDINTQAVLENLQPGTSEGGINAVGNFDRFIYPEDRPWCMFNVILIGRRRGTPLTTAYRQAIGRIHVDAFLAHRPTEVIIDLE